MTITNHSDAAPRLPGVVRSGPLQLYRKKRPALLTLIFLTAAGVAAIGGFFASALWLFAGFFGLISVISRLARKYPPVTPLETLTPFDREIMPGTVEYRRRQERLWG